MIGFLQMEKKGEKVMAAQTVDSWAARWGCDCRGRGGRVGGR